MRGVKGYTSTWYPKWKRSCQQFEYEPLVLSLELETLDEEKYRKDFGGAGPLGTRTIKKELGDFIGGKESPNKE